MSNSGIPPYDKAVWVGDVGPVLQDVPRGTEVDIVRVLPDNKYRVRVKAGQGLIPQEWDAFTNEVYLL